MKNMEKSTTKEFGRVKPPQLRKPASQTKND